MFQPYDERASANRGRDEDRRFGGLANRAITELAARRQRRGLPERHLKTLLDAVDRPDPAQRAGAVTQMRDQGITVEEICDHYIPEAAKRLGDDWLSDRKSFAHVSMATARLQSLLRALDDGQGDQLGFDDTGRMRILVLADAHHTLGALVLSSQLRRMGATVRLVLGADPGEVRTALGEASFDAVFLSSCRADAPEAVRPLVDQIRAAGRDTRILVGGGICLLDPTDIRRATGCDHVTNDAAEAMDFVAKAPGRCA